MIPKIVYWEIKNHHESGFDLIEITEDGVLNKRAFINQGGDYRDVCFTESACLSKSLQGKIVLQKISFDKDNRYVRASLDGDAQTVTQFSMNDWKMARKALEECYLKMGTDLSSDFRLMLSLENEQTTEIAINKSVFPIVDFRVINQEGFCLRSEPRELFAVEFLPTLNEKFYFQYLPRTKQFIITGDNLFAIETKTIADALDDLSFLEHVQLMRKTIESNEDYYRQVINEQRARRAMLDTEIIGDLYPR